MNPVMGAPINVSFQLRGTPRTRNLFTHIAQSPSKQSSRPRIVINVSGEKYETWQTTLDRFPDTLLGDTEKRLVLASNNGNEIFIDRHRRAFEAILFFYQSAGKLARPVDISMEDFVEECSFYEIPEAIIKGMKERESYLCNKKLTLPRRYNKVRNYLWNCFEFPLMSTTYFPIVYFGFTYAVTILSVGMFCIETELLRAHYNLDRDFYIDFSNKAEVATNTFLALDLFMRVLVNPFPREYVLNPLNIIECCSLCPFLLLYWCPKGAPANTLIYITRLLRTLSLCKATRISHTIKTALNVVQVSVLDIAAILFVISVMVLFCGSVLYYVEMTAKNTTINSIPMSLWWAVQTLFCLGYGDVVPTTLLGKTVASVVLTFGVVLVTVLLLSLGSRVFETYSKETGAGSFLNLKF